MKAYVIYAKDKMGYESDRIYRLEYSSASQDFNNLLKKTIKDIYTPISKEDFSKEVLKFKSFHKKVNIENFKLIFSKFPFILYKEKEKLIATVYSLDNIVDESEKYHIITDEVILEEVKFI